MKALGRKGAEMGEREALIADPCEWEVVLAWHRQQQYDCAQREDYTEADHHKRRAEQIARSVPIARKGAADD